MRYSLFIGGPATDIMVENIILLLMLTLDANSFLFFFCVFKDRFPKLKQVLGAADMVGQSYKGVFAATLQEILE